MLRVARFLRSFVRHSVPRVDDRRVTLTVGDAEVPASFVRPPGRSPLPGWILLHGITVSGREHPALKRFAHALASTGAAVLIPEVPAWRRLDLDPSVGDATIEAAANHLTVSDEVAGSNLNLVGFSFGATQALMSAASPGIAKSVRAIVAFGGYCDLGRTVRFMTTGEHEWQGHCQRMEPDPYGRWIVVGNHLTDVPQFAHMRELQEAARELAMEAGRLGTYAADPVYDPVRRGSVHGFPESSRRSGTFSLRRSASSHRSRKVAPWQHSCSRRAFVDNPGSTPNPFFTTSTRTLSSYTATTTD